MLNIAIICGFSFFIIVLYFILVVRKPRDFKDVVTALVVVGSGGHTAEMMRLLCKLDCSKYNRHYVLADNDSTSELKIHHLEKSFGSDTAYSIHKIPRSRNVGQSYLTAVLSTLYSTIYSFRVVYALTPDLVLCNGPGTCVPICVVAYALSVIFRRTTKIVFVESICRVRSLSLTGKILRCITNHIIVQWPELQDLYPGAKYIGRLF